MKETQKGSLFIILAMSIFGLYGIFIRSINLPSFVIVFYNFLFAAIIMSAYFLVKDKSIFKFKNYFWLLMALSVFAMLNNLFFFKSFQLTTISNAVLTHYTAPIFVAIFAPLFLKEKLEKITLVALLISIVGLILILSNNFSFNDTNFLGIIYGTASGLMYGFVIIILKHLSGKLSIYTINIYMAFIAAAILTPFIITSRVTINTSTWFMLLLIALIFGITATLLHINGVKRVKSQHAGVLAYSEPFTAPIYAFLFFSEIPTFNTIIGGSLVIFSGYLIIRDQK
jgi:drug/metabolite transporter (DMT)-like permease